MNHQLHLITPEDKAPWRLDAETRDVGRRGLAQARKALSAARQSSQRPARPAPRPTSHSHVRAQMRRSAA